jgi:hypothetical protein
MDPSPRWDDKKRTRIAVCATIGVVITVDKIATVPASVNLVIEFPYLVEQRGALITFPAAQSEANHLRSLSSRVWERSMHFFEQRAVRQA